MSSEPTEQLLDAFKAAALSVTKLYKTSAAAQTKSRADGYQDCLDDILSFLDKEHMGLSDGEGWMMRKWATERLEGRDLAPHTAESDDEVEKAETMSSPEIHRSTSARQPSPGLQRNEDGMRDSAPPTLPIVEPAVEEEQPEEQRHQEPKFVVPSLDTFNFQLQPSHAYQQEAYLNLANLDLSDSHATPNPTSAPLSRSIRTRQGNPPRGSARTGGSHLGRGAGQKRRLNLGEIFDLASLEYGNREHPFGNGGAKRSRHS